MSIVLNCFLFLFFLFKKKIFFTATLLIFIAFPLKIPVVELHITTALV